MEPSHRDVRGLYSFAMIRIAILIDGGHLRVITRHAGHTYNPNYIEKVALACVAQGETLFRCLNYDCAPFVGKTKLPVSGDTHEFKGNDDWLKQLASKDLFAVRRGVLKFRGYKPKNVPITPQGLTDADFKPDFEQKGVDMRIGLDIANFCRSKVVDRIILITADTDCIPAMKYARIAGLQVALVSFPKQRLAAELVHHADFRRNVAWP